MQHERDHHDQIPADHPDIEKVHDPQPSSDAQHKEHCQYFAKHYPAQAAEVDGETCDEWIDFKSSRADGETTIVTDRTDHLGSPAQRRQVESPSPRLMNLAEYTNDHV